MSDIAPAAHDPIGWTVLDRAYRPLPEVALEPPPPDAAATVLAGDAYRSAQERGGRSTDNGPIIQLALATITGRGSPGARNPTHRPIVDRLVYALRWDDMVWMPVGAALPEGEPLQGPVIGVQLILVDARTGDVILHRLSGTPRG